MSEEDTTLTADSAAVMKHLEMNQGIINRMAANSAECKKWAVALVSAALVIVAEKGNTDFLMIALIPVFSFFFIDAYYLALERFFINEQKIFVNKLHIGQLCIEEIYVFKGPKRILPGLLDSFRSWSVWPFYLGLIIVVTLLQFINV